MKQTALVPSRYLVGDKRKVAYIHSLVNRLWKLPPHIRYNPRPNLISLERKHFEILEKNPYKVAFKTDGVGYLLLLGTYPHNKREFSVMINRKYDIFEVQVMARKVFFKGSLFDGELVAEYEPGLPNERHLFRIFDCVAVMGVSCVNETYEKRHELYCRAIDIQPYDIIQDPKSWKRVAEEIVTNQQKIVCMGNPNCLQFRPKTGFRLEYIPMLLRQKRTLRHKTDGIIFTPNAEPIRTGTHFTLFKWKPEPTIDLEWHCMYDEHHPDEIYGWIMHTFYHNKGTRVDAVVDGILCPPYQKAKKPIIVLPNHYMIKVLDHYRARTKEFRSIVECSIMLRDDYVQCEIVRMRYDKQRPNNVLTIERTLQNVYENITERELVERFAHTQNHK